MRLPPSTLARVVVATFLHAILRLVSSHIKSPCQAILTREKHKRMEKCHKLTMQKRLIQCLLCSTFSLVYLGLQAPSTVSMTAHAGTWRKQRLKSSMSSHQTCWCTPQCHKIVQRVVAPNPQLTESFGQVSGVRI